jgi:serine/threonine protein kinase
LSGQVSVPKIIDFGYAKYLSQPNKDFQKDGLNPFYTANETFNKVFSIQSDVFSVGALYFHLLVRADDDGVVEAFNVLRMTGSNEDDLKVLVAKGFVKILNDDLVSFVTDWYQHNMVRADRKIDSIYQDLLLQVVPDIKLIEHRARADQKAKKTMDGQWTA